MTLAINGVTAGPLLRKLGLAESTESREKIVLAYQSRFKTHLIGLSRTCSSYYIRNKCHFSSLLFLSAFRGNGVSSFSGSVSPGQFCACSTPRPLFSRSVPVQPQGSVPLLFLSAVSSSSLSVCLSLSLSHRISPTTSCSFPCYDTMIHRYDKIAADGGSRKTPRHNPSGGIPTPLFETCASLPTGKRRHCRCSFNVGLDGHSRGTGKGRV